MVEDKLRQMGIELPAAPTPLAAYIPAVKAGDFAYTSGQIPLVKGELKYKGKVGAELTEADGYQAGACLCY